MKIRVRVTADFEIDPEAWVAAGIEAEHLTEGEVDPADYISVAWTATSHMAAEDHLPRWARDSVMVTHESVEVVK